MLTEFWNLAFKTAQEHGYGDLVLSLAILSAPIIVVASVFGWILGKRSTIANIRKTHAETEKSRSESRLKYQELLAAVEEKQIQLEEQKRQMDALLKEVRDILESKRKRILKDARDGLCSFHSNEYFPAFVGYLTLCQTVLPASECRLRMEGEIVPALETQIKFINVINSQQFFERITTGAKYLIRADTIRVIFRRVRRGVPFWHIRRRRRLRELEKRWNQVARHS